MSVRVTDDFDERAYIILCRRSRVTQTIAGFRQAKQATAWGLIIR